MASVTVYISRDVRKTDREKMRTMLQDIAQVTRLLVGSMDVQFQMLRVEYEVFQFIEINERMVPADSSTVAIEIIAVEEAPSKKTLDLLAGCVVSILCHYFPNIKNPNTWIRIYGASASGWFEGIPSTNQIDAVLRSLDKIKGMGLSHARAYAMVWLNSAFPA